MTKPSYHEGTFRFLFIVLSVLSLISELKNHKQKEIVRTWLAGHSSCTLVIPKEFAREYGLDQPSHVVIEGTSEGILIRKLEV